MRLYHSREDVNFFLHPQYDGEKSESYSKLCQWEEYKGGWRGRYLHYTWILREGYFYCFDSEAERPDLEQIKKEWLPCDPQILAPVYEYILFQQ